MNGVRKLIITIAAVATAMSMATPGQADIIYSNIQPGDNFGPGVAIGVVPFVGVFNYAGEGFIPTQNYNFDSVEMAASLSSGPNILDVYLMGTVGGLPSGILESYTLNNELSNNPATGMVTIDSLSHPLLEAGMEYWVVAAGGPTTTVFWAQNVHNIMGPNVSGLTLSTLVLDSSSNVIMAMQVDGTTVPEPASWTLLLGVLGLAGVYVSLTRPLTTVADRAVRISTVCAHVGVPCAPRPLLSDGDCCETCQRSASRLGDNASTIRQSPIIRLP